MKNSDICFLISNVYGAAIFIQYDMRIPVFILYAMFLLGWIILGGLEKSK